ncbi:MAG: hypothetical protein ACXWNK_12610 [Vulcanimicrobiaceae bacterium]
MLPTGWRSYRGCFYRRPQDTPSSLRYPQQVKISAGALRAFFLYDVADTIDLSRLRTVGGEGLAPADLPLRPHTSPAYLQFPIPPLVARLPDVRFNEMQLGRRVKLFDYGVISIRLSVGFSGEWEAFVALVAELRNSDALAAVARTSADGVMEEIADVLDDPHSALIEDYFVTEIDRFATPVTAADLLANYSTELTQLLAGERGLFSPLQIEESLRQRFSYYADDLTIVQWDGALVYDRPESAEAIEDILEFANSQLVELRTYDALLDRELDAIYAAKVGKPLRSLFGRRAAEQAASLRYVIVDVLELTDRASNALKIIGDAYYARIYRAAITRLALGDWHRQINEKLDSIRDMYRIVSDQTRSNRDEFLEIIVIVLIMLEVVIGVLTLRH